MAAKTRETAESVWDAVALIELPAKKYFKIGEVAALVGVEPHVLRYWQTQFRQVRPQKSRSGHRQYRRRDVENLLAIKELLHVQRFTIAGARQALKSAPSTLPRPASPDSTLPRAAASQMPQAAEGANAASSTSHASASAAARTSAAPAAVAPPVVATSSGHQTEANGALTSPASARDDVAVFEVVSVDTDSQLRRALEGEYAEQIGAQAQVDIQSEASAPLADSSPTPDPSKQQPASPSSATDGASAKAGSLPTGGPPTGSHTNGNGASSSETTSHQSAAPQVDLEVPRRRRSLVSQQLGFGFVPTAHEVLAAARREALDLLELLDREDAADRRHNHSKV